MAVARSLLTSTGIEAQAYSAQSVRVHPIRVNLPSLPVEPDSSGA
jgi:hypothetical protein